MSAVLYWKCHCQAYPHLSQIAKVYLMLSASSVPVESRFSLAGLVKTRVAHQLRRIISVSCMTPMLNFFQ